MGLRTALTDRFGIDHPVVLAPMGGVAGGALSRPPFRTAAVWA